MSTSFGAKVDCKESAPQHLPIMFGLASSAHKRVMKTRWLTSDSSEVLMAADQLIRHPRVSTNDLLVGEQVSGIHTVKFCPRATALVHWRGKVTAVDIAENVEHLYNLTSVSFSSRVGITQELSRLHNL